MSWLDYIAPPPQGDYQNYIERKYGVGRAPATTPEPEPTPPPAPGYDGGAGRARNRQSFTPTMRNESARNRGALTGAAFGSTPYVNPLFQVVGSTGGSPGYDNRASVAA